MENKLPGLVRRGNKLSIRRRVPDDVRHVIGKNEIWRSLGTGDERLAREVYWKLNAEIEEEFSRARSSLNPREPKPLTSEMARLFAVAWFSPKIEDEVEYAQDNFGEDEQPELQEQLAEIYDEEAHLITGVAEVLRPSLQYTADEILIKNGFPIRNQ